MSFGKAVHRGELVVRRGEAHLQARDLAEPALLLVSELVTPACGHAAAPYRLVLFPVPEGLWVEMADAGDATRVVGPDQPAVPGRFGMRLIATLARRLTVTHHDGGKTIWAEQPSLPRLHRPCGMLGARNRSITVGPRTSSP
ncbi:ATP-binding protein [Streptomyces sp. NRRL WC-3618]|uniref:ATP-binding protein n=1 Tax=Streptomyces sp. NRRL WC-3618 TaxID=1519490 RepID=UPI000B169FF8|nr:ATP-binding protein [Streptomyces sp. NRRL WC-3618]